MYISLAYAVIISISFLYEFITTIFPHNPSSGSPSIKKHKKSGSLTIMADLVNVPSLSLPPKNKSSQNVTDLVPPVSAEQTPTQKYDEVPKEDNTIDEVE